LKIGTIYTLYGRRAGAELYFEKIIFGMLDRYKEITFVVYCNEEAFTTLGNNCERIEKILIRHLDNQIKKMFWLEVLSKKIVDSEQLDVFWIPSGTNNFPGRWSVPTVVTFHDFGEYHVKNKYDLKRTFYRKLICIPKSLQRAGRITAVSQTTAADISHLFGIDKVVDVVYSGPSPRGEIKQHTNPAAIVMSETGISLGKIFFAPGRTDFVGKGLDLLLRSYANFINQVPEAPQLILVGPKGENHQKLVNDIITLRLEHKVHWLGRVSDNCIDALYQMSEMVIFASRYEGFGFPLLEAMKYRVPIISSDAGALPEIAGNAAVFFQSGNLHALTEAMIKLHLDENLRADLVSLGLERIKSFNWENTYSSMKTIFEVAKNSNK